MTARTFDAVSLRIVRELRILRGLSRRRLRFDTKRSIDGRGRPVQKTDAEDRRNECRNKDPDAVCFMDVQHFTQLSDNDFIPPGTISL